MRTDPEADADAPTMNSETRSRGMRRRRRSRPAPGSGSVADGTVLATLGEVTLESCTKRVERIHAREGTSGRATGCAAFNKDGPQW